MHELLLLVLRMAHNGPLYLTEPAINRGNAMLPIRCVMLSFITLSFAAVSCCGEEQEIDRDVAYAQVGSTTR